MTGNLRYPWTGGLNSCQFVTIDLDLDGIQDLLIFDRHGNRKLTFINTGTPGVIDYRFEPSFARLLPAVMEECGLARVVTLVHERHAVSRRWLRRLGFREERLRPGLLGGETYIHCVREAPCQQQRP